MKQLFFILCVTFFATLHTFGQEYVISGEVKGADGKTVSLRQFRDSQPVEVGTTTVQAGKFTLKGTTTYPEFSMLYVDERGPVQFFVENTNIRILVDLEKPEKSTITGSKESDIMKEFVDEMEKYAQQQKKLQDSYVTLSTLSIASPDALTNTRAQLEKLQADRNAFVINFVQKYSGKISTAFLIPNASLLQILELAQVEQFVNSFDAKSSQSQWVKPLKEHVVSHKRSAVGQPFPDVTMKTPDEQPISISDYAGKGKYVLLDFWAAWCGPCRNANPRVVELYNKYKDKGFEIIGISLDRGKPEWVEAIKKDNLTWPQMSDLNYWQSAAAKLYSVSAIPHTVLLDKDGKIIAKGLHVDALAAKLAEIFGN